MTDNDLEEIHRRDAAVWDVLPRRTAETYAVRGNGETQRMLDMSTLLAEVDRLNAQVLTDEKIAAMTDAERSELREELFGNYCHACCGPLPCSCWNDE